MAEQHLSSPNGDAPVADAPLPLKPARTLLRFRDQPLAAEADETPSRNGSGPAPGSPISLDQRRERLAETLRKKVEQGYRIESQTDTDAILVTKGRRRWFGILGNAAESRQRTAIDEAGRASTRTL